MVLAVDGGGQALVSGYLREGALPAFQRLAAEGALSDGLIPAFPSKTAASFAMAWTGQPPRVNGVTGNSVLRTPASAHSLLETEDGFSAEVLRVDPLWTRVARSGRRAVALHTTHSWPFEASLGDLPPDVRDRLHLLTGYAGARLAPETITRAPGGEFAFAVGDSRFLGRFFDDPADPASGWDALAVRAEDGGPWLARVGVGPEGGFSSRIAALVGDVRVEFRVRAFEADPATGEVVAFRTGASAVAMRPGFRERLGEPAWSRTLGAAETASGRLGPPFGEAAQPRLREIMGRVADDALEHLEAAAAIPDWDFLALYLPVADEAGHLLHGYLDERLDPDPEIAAAVRPTLEAAFGEVDRVLDRMLGIAREHGAHVIVFADHGMAGTDRMVHLNEALERAGLLEFGSDGLPDLARTTAMLLTTGDGSVALNRVSRPSGIVAPDEEAGAWRAVEEALLAIRHEGEPVVTGFLRPVAAPGPGFVFPGGDSTGELFPLLRSGFLSSPRPAETIVTTIRPAGSHGFVPTRRDMQGVFAAWGPRIAPGSRWPRASALDVTPTALDLMGLPPDPALSGRSLLDVAPLVEPTGRRTGTGSPRGR